MSIHTGHRTRVRERFLNEGLDRFKEHEALEMLLFYCVARKDTNELAHRLINAFGSLPAVLDATPAELERVTGVGQSISTFFSFLNALNRYQNIKRADMQIQILSNADARANYLLPRISSERNEVVYILCLDGKHKLIDCKRVGEGSINSVGVPIRRIVELALNLNATSVVLSHNHPTGLALPSPEDLEATRFVATALQTVDVALVDHIIVADGDYVSMKQSNYFLNEGVFANH